MITQLYKAPDAPVSVQKALDYLHTNAVPITYTSTIPTAAHVPTGGIVIHDDGNGTKRLYVRTGQDNVGYISLT